MFDSTHIRAEADGGVLVVIVKCEKLSEYESTVVQNEIQEHAKGMSWKVAIDCAQLQIISSVGLGMLISLNRLCKTNKGKLTIFGLNDQLRGLLKLSKIDAVLGVHADRAGALKALA